MKTKTGLKSERGVSIIGMAFMLLVIGMLSVAGISYYKTWKAYETEAETKQNLEFVQDALEEYFARNGRYPCPAALTTGVDNAGFGQEVLTDCTAADVPGTFRAAGRDGRIVRTGTIPTRTLGLPDTYMFDGYDNRLIYAVTEDYAVDGTLVNGDLGAIFIEDTNGNNATSVPGNIVQTVFSMGRDNNGAYSIDGQLKSPCNAGEVSGENCNFGVDAVFLNTANKSQNEANLFVHNITYTAGKSITPCADTGITPPGNAAFLVDTSGSMSAGGNCPASMPGCSRIDAARWAMRRIMPAVIYNNSLIDDPGQTSMTGFVGYNNVGDVSSNLGGMIFDDPTDPFYVPPDETTLLNNLETELQGMCPTGSTPLGIHLQALADSIGDGTPDRPNKITVISDGVSNNGTDPIAVSLYIQSTYPNLQVDIVDVTGNPSLMQIADNTNGNYYATANPDELLDALYASAGICTPFTPSVPTDSQGCGSSGSW